MALTSFDLSSRHMRQHMSVNVSTSVTSHHISTNSCFCSTTAQDRIKAERP